MCESHYYRTTAELDALPGQAVIYAGDNRVWQHGFKGRLYGWLLPGDPNVYAATAIELPARLLDDGL